MIHYQEKDVFSQNKTSVCFVAQDSSKDIIDGAYLLETSFGFIFTFK